MILIIYLILNVLYYSEINMNNFNKVFIETELINSYLTYALSVIIGRALPDVRDGLKPVHRRTLFAMRELNNKFNKQYKKSARIVGDVIGKYHPHGEIAVYDSIVRLTQSFILRYPLIDGQGNFGSIDGDSAAAMRYTEIRMTELSEYLMLDLDFETVDYISNYDGNEKIPTILPSQIPNLLINGSYGIAVGMATNIPPHNINEVINACLAFIENPEINIKNLMHYISGPDFPTYGFIYGLDGILDAYKTGKGKIIVRGNVKINNTENKNSIIITELPYQVNKSILIQKILLLIEEKKIIGIKLIRDESNKDGLRIFIEIDYGKNANVILNQIYSLTKLETTFSINMVALVNNSPKLLSLKDMIELFINHRKEIVYRRTYFKLSNLKKKLHTLEGLLVVLFDMDFLLKIFTSSNSLDELKKILVEKNWNNKNINNIDNIDNNDEIISNFKDYKLSKLQIQNILDLKLSNLVKIERNKILNDYIKINNDIKSYKLILNNDKLLFDIIKDELFVIKNKFGDKRRTIIIKDIQKFDAKDLISKESIIIILSKLGYIKSQLSKTYQAQKRGGKGKISIFIKPNDSVNNLLVCDTHGMLLCFSNFGKVYWIDLYKFPISSRTSKGIPIVNLLNLQKNDMIKTMLFIKSYEKFKYVLMVTAKGIIKKILLNEFKNQRTNGIIATILSNNDYIVDVKLVKTLDEIMLFSNVGKAIKFSIKNIRCTSRLSRGVKGMTLEKNEHIVSLLVINKPSYIITATENGFGKKSISDDYPLTCRGGKGVRGIRIDKKTGNVVKVEKVYSCDDLLLVTTSGIMSRINTKDISCTGRNTKGVVLINLSNKEKLTCIKKI